LGRIMPSDELHHFSDGLEPPTRIEYDWVWSKSD
jgi:hypothetical protein